MKSTTLSRGQGQSGLTGRHVLIAAAGFFGVIFAVNGVLLWKALSTHSGLVAQEPYRKGLAYNERIAADARQRNLGWIADLHVEPPGPATLALTDSTGRAVTGLAIRGSIGRPSSNAEDVRLSFAEQEPGSYVAPMPKIGAGSWQVDIEARAATAGEQPMPEPVYRMRRRLWLKP